MTPEPKRAKTSEAPRLWSWLTFPQCCSISFQVPCSFTLHLWCGSSVEDDYAVKVNAMIGMKPVMALVICYLSERGQTTGIGLTIIPAKYAHVVNFCVRVYSISNAMRLIMHCLKYTPGASASFPNQLIFVWSQTQIHGGIHFGEYKTNYINLY